MGITKQKQTMAKEIKKTVGRPPIESAKNTSVTVRFKEEEMKQIKLYLKKHKIKSVSQLIRLSVKEKVSQLDAFRDI
jgi:hypothetical protein